MRLRPSQMKFHLDEIKLHLDDIKLDFRRIKVSKHVYAGIFNALRTTKEERAKCESK